jgi:hypothetical protein
MRFEIRKGVRAIGYTDDYATAAQFYMAGYDVTGFGHTAH